MIDNYVSANRRAPFEPPAQQHAAVENTAQSKGLQEDTAASSSMQPHAVLTPEEFTISVEQVREHFRSKGLHKSKDTVQRWCRSGDLACQKRGVLNRYFTTEASLKKLEQKLLPDMMAEGAGEVAADVQVHAATPTDANNGMPLHAGEDTAVRSDMQPDEAKQAPLHEAADEQKVDPSKSRVAHGDIASLREQLKSKDSEIEFLREEIRAARSERSNVVQISHRMMEAMETMVIGGKVDRLNSVENNHKPAAQDDPR